MHKPLLASICAAALIALFTPPFAPSRAQEVDAPAIPAPLETGTTNTVVEIVDGDTLLLDDGREVRLVGLQAPKLPLGRPNFDPWPLADKAKAALGEITLGRQVTLAYGGRRIDRHGRALAHLFRDEGLWVQAEMLRRGLARVYSFADNRTLVDRLLQIERVARAERRGIWNDPYYQIRKPNQLGEYIDTFQLVEGQVEDVAEVDGRVYINFGRNWRTDFTVTLAPKVRRLFEAEGIDPEICDDHMIRVRGWLSRYNGPMIEVTHPEQIERLAP